ncbi:MAG: FecR domain-containing protein [Pseudodesulfovibrio sp.]|uniref:FecR family protein n=1 Tax=Pseudodesulfovibrio sp. TaxID=2035812 RepID=UPI003D0E9AC7
MSRFLAKTIRAVAPTGSRSASLIVLLMLFLLAATPALAMDRAQTVGSIKTLTGEVFIERNGEKLVAEVGGYLLEGDTLVTGENSSIGVIFRDDTILSLGSRSTVRIDRFVFDPAAENMSFLTNVRKGTVQFISGQMTRLQPGSMVVETPLSTIGIRGTRFLIKVD